MTSKIPPLIFKTSYFKDPISQDKYIKLTPKPTIKQRLTTLNRSIKPPTKELYLYLVLILSLQVLALITPYPIIITIYLLSIVLTTITTNMYMSSHYYWGRLAEYTLITDSKLFRGVDTEKLVPLSELELALFKLPEHIEQYHIDTYLNKYGFMSRL